MELVTSPEPNFALMPTALRVGDRVRFVSPASTPERSALWLALAAIVGAALLDRRTGHRPVGAEHAAVTVLGLEQLAARRALVEILAGIGAHRLGLRRPAIRAGQRRQKDNRRRGGRHIGPSIQNVSAISATADATEIRVTTLANA